MSCSICETRKEKRFCPAVHGRICPQCCGTGRENTLDCPSECPYLQQARRIELERPRGVENLDPAALFPQVSIEERFIYEREPLIAGLTSGLAKAARADRSLTDRDLIAALTVLARAFERLVSSGLHYAESVPSGAQQLVVNQLQQMLTEFRELEQKHLGHTTLRDSDTLKAFVFLLRTAEGRTSGRPRSRAFIDFLFEQFPQKESLIAGPQEAGSRLIVP